METGFAVRIILFSTAMAMATSPLCAGRLRAEFGADQVFVSRHCRFGLIPPAVSGRLLPPSAAIPRANARGTSGSYAHAAALGHEPDVAVTLALDAVVVLA